jgi:hypothetical protein
MGHFYWERHPDGPFVTLIAVAATYLHPESGNPGSLQRRAKRDNDEVMRVFKAELSQAIRDPGQLPATSYPTKSSTTTAATRNSCAASGTTSTTTNQSSPRLGNPNPGQRG